MADRAIKPTPQTYTELRDAVIAVVLKGRQEIDQAWLLTYHEAGRLIHEHLLFKKDRANYGASVFSRLAEDTNISSRTLHECVQFYRYFPIVRAPAQLNWNHYRLLCQTADSTQRTKLLMDTTKNHWTAAELQTRVREVNAAAISANGNHVAAPIELLHPQRGTPGLHPIVDRGDGPVVDLGFKLYRALGPTAKLTPSDIVRLNDDGVRRIDGATTVDLFTYNATIRRVIDGDTLLVALAVAPGITLELKLRLRGLDCPEMSTAAGRAAKRFVDNLLTAGDEVVIRTTKPDKYDRYLADVFIAPKSRAESPESSDEIFLNNALLENGHAVRYDGEAKDE